MYMCAVYKHNVIKSTCTHTTHAHTASSFLLLSPPQVTLFLGKLNAIAPFVTMFFLVSYMVVNLACFALKVAAAPNFRPTFQIYARYTCKCMQAYMHSSRFRTSFERWVNSVILLKCYTLYNVHVPIENPYKANLQIPLDSPNVVFGVLLQCKSGYF